MSTSLEANLAEIKRQKDTYLLPSNLKQGVTLLGVTGTLNCAKLFDTVEHMRQDPDPQPGDLAVVYKNSILPVAETSVFSSCLFPTTVVLDSAYSDYFNFRFCKCGFAGYGTSVWFS